MYPKNNPDTQWRVALYNLGCRVNRYESDAVSAQLREAGFQIVDFDERADLYIVNTCAVTAEASRKSGQFLRRAKKMNPEALVVAMGCLTALEGEHKNADFSIGNQGKSKLALQLADLLKNRKSLSPKVNEGPAHQAEGIPDGERFGQFEEYGAVAEQSETRAFIKIQDGCNQFCAYCTIPLARGRVCSRSEDDILAEARALAEAGYREITLTGIHVCSYGLDLGQDSLALMDLCDKLAELPGLERLRFGSVEPLSISPDFVRRFANNKKLCHHLHLSLQSGAEHTLRRMKRNYSPLQFREVVKNLREWMPDFTLTTDLIVGFPGETEAEHQESLAFCEAIQFAHMHIFRYSPRPLTAAANMKDQVPAEVSERRAKEAGELAKQSQKAVFEKALGQRAHVLLEQGQKRSEDGLMKIWTGYTEHYLPVQIELSEGVKGDIVELTLRSMEGDTLIGEK